MKKFSTIDLFAGAGGLSLGFLQTNKYDIKVAFEKNPDMQETYKKNHPGVDVRGDVCAADYSEIQKKYGAIDVVIGGPPCQGFSNANRQKNHAVSQNNMLVKQYIRAITELQPKAFVMENVSMLKSDVHRFYLDTQDVKTLERYEIPTTPSKLVLLDAKHYYAGALEIVKNEDAVKTALWPENDYAVLNIVYKASKNTGKMKEALEKHKKALKKCADKYLSSDEEYYHNIQTKKAFNAVREYYDGTIRLAELASRIEPAIMIQRMLGKAKEIFENNLVVDEYNSDNGLTAIIRSYAVFDYLKAILGAAPNNYAICAKVLCAADFGAPQKRMRFVIIGIKREIRDTVLLPMGTFKEEEYRTVQDAIADLENVVPVIDLKDDHGITIPRVTDLGKFTSSLRNTDVLYNHIITKTSDVAMKRFKALKQGQNFHALDESLKTNTYTDVSRTQNTIYLRLDYAQPSGTVVNVRKSMWIHPVLDRAISVREAARLQTFPDSFVFCGTKDKQYQQVGNAVPPIMANAIAKVVAEQLMGQCDKSEK